MGYYPPEASSVAKLSPWADAPAITVIYADRNFDPAELRMVDCEDGAINIDRLLGGDSLPSYFQPALHWHPNPDRTDGNAVEHSFAVVQLQAFSWSTKVVHARKRNFAYRWMAHETKLPPPGDNREGARPAPVGTFVVGAREARWTREKSLGARPSEVPPVAGLTTGPPSGRPAWSVRHQDDLVGLHVGGDVVARVALEVPATPHGSMIRALRQGGPVRSWATNGPQRVAQSGEWRIMEESETAPDQHCRFPQVPDTPPLRFPSCKLVRFLPFGLRRTGRQAEPGLGPWTLEGAWQ